MAQLRLYRRIFSIECIRTGSTVDQNYTLIDPISISATTTSSLDSSLIETFNSPVHESTGVYYIDIFPNAYAWDINYTVNWDVQYDSTSQFRRIISTFMLNPINIGSEIVIELNSF